MADVTELTHTPDRLGRSGLRRRLALRTGLIAAVVASVAVPVMAQTISVRTPSNHLTQLGPISGENGFPVWYRDSTQPTGTRVEGCLDGSDPLCGLLPDPGYDPAKPTSFPDNFPEEFFYSSATALTTMPNGGLVTVVLALEGAFATGPVVPGDQMVFGRVRVKITNVAPGTTYTVVHPYGVDKYTASDKGLIFETEDVGLTPGDFTGALNSRISPFLRWTGGAPAGYLGDPGITHAVTGSPYLDAAGQPQNYVAIYDSDGVEVPGTRTDQFSVLGKLATSAGIDVQSVTYTPDAAGSDAGTLSVYATSEPDQAIQVATDQAAGIVNTTLLGDSGRYFGRIHYLHKPASVKVLNAGDVPVSSKIVPLTDVVTVTRAAFDGTQLTVDATSSDPNAVLTVAGFGSITGASTTFGTAGVPLTVVPSAIKVTSDQGGSGIEPVAASGPALAPTPIIASAGADQDVQQGAAVTLDASGSSGEIASYSWAQTPAAGEPAVALTGNGATATFTAPNAEATLHFTVTITGVSGQTDTATTTVTVLPIQVGGPVADAGAAQTVPRGTKVTLDGSATTGASTYAWTQTAGDPVVLTGANTAKPTFTYPLFKAANGSTNTPLAFTLTVTGPGANPTSTATTTVTPALDTTTVTARFRTRGEWRISGVASPFTAGQTITIHAGPGLNSPVLGTAVVSTADGTWNFKKTVPASNTAPSTTVSVESTLGFTQLAIAVSVTN